MLRLDTAFQTCNTTCIWDCSQHQRHDALHRVLWAPWVLSAPGLLELIVCVAPTTMFPWEEANRHKARAQAVRVSVRRPWTPSGNGEGLLLISLCSSGGRELAGTSLLFLSPCDRWGEC